MKFIKAIVRPEKVFEVLDSLREAGFSAATRVSVLGRGKQRGLKVGEVHYDEIPKEEIMIVVEDKDEETVTKIVAKTCRTGKKGAFGDGKIFVIPVEKVVTVSSGDEKL